MSSAALPGEAKPAAKAGPSRRRPLWKRWLRAVRNALVGWVGPPLLTLYGGTLRVRWVAPHHLGTDPHLRLHPSVVAFWHQRMVLLLHAYRKSGIVVLVSEHGDGEMVARVCRRLGYGLVRGSSTRGGVSATLALGRSLGEGATIAITPDGPRGPPHVFRDGAVYLASRHGLPILPMAVAYKRAWRAPTWDGFLLPVPWTRAIVTVGEPFHVPVKLSREDAESYRAEAERRLRELTRESDERFDELFAAGERRSELAPGPAPPVSTWRTPARPR